MANAEQRLIVAVASWPHPTEAVNGDGWAVEWSATGCRIAIIDGLGHGSQAAHATAAAQEVLASHPDLPPDAAVLACHQALARTRGAAIGVMHVDLDNWLLTYAAVGNTEARLVRPEKTDRLIAYRGIVGRHMRTVRLFQFELSSVGDWLLVLHTDGVSQSFDLEDFPAFHRRDAQELADAILQTAGRHMDDATVIVALPEAGPSGS